MIPSTVLLVLLCSRERFLSPSVTAVYFPNTQWNHFGRSRSLASTLKLQCWCWPCIGSGYRHVCVRSVCTWLLFIVTYVEERNDVYIFTPAGVLYFGYDIEIFYLNKEHFNRFFALWRRWLLICTFYPFVFDNKAVAKIWILFQFISSFITVSSLQFCHIYK